MKFITKKNIIILSVICILVFFVSAYAYDNNLICGERWKCYDALEVVAYLCLAIVISLVPGYITFFLAKPIFERWKKFAIWAIPIALIFFIFITFLDGGSIDYGFDLVFIWLLFILYFLTSLIIIFRAWRKERKAKRNE